LPPIRAGSETGAPLQGVSKPTAAALPPGDMGRILRPQAAYRWLLPQISAITPTYIEQTLRGALAGNHVQAWELFDLMLDTWPELASCTNEIAEGVLARKLVIDAFAEEGEQPSEDALLKCKVVSSALRRMDPDQSADENDLDGTIKDILSAWFVGQAVLEVNWDAAPGSDQLNIIRCGQLGAITAPRSTFWVHPVCYGWSLEGRIGLRDTSAGVKKPVNPTPWNPVTYQARGAEIVEFPADKFLVAIHKAKSGTALGGALLRPLAWWWCAANFSANWLMNFAQLFGLPIRIANYDPNAAPETVAKICDMLQNMGSASWAAFPAGTTIDLKESSKGGSDSPQVELLDRADRYARLLILGQTMSGGTDSSKGGGKAFGQVESGVKEVRIDAAGKFAAGVINTQLACSILRLNFGNADECPSIRFMEEEEGGLQDAQRDQTLASAGLEIGKNFLRKKYGIPAPGKDEDVIGGSAAPTGQGGTGFQPVSQKPNMPMNAQAAGETGWKPVPPSELTNTVLEELTGVQEKWLGGLKPVFHRLIALAESGNVTDEDFIQALEKAQKEMPELFHKLDTAALQDALEKAMGAAVVNGAVAGAMARRVRG
jgi:phage gp29-like protein